MQEFPTPVRMRSFAETRAFLAAGDSTSMCIRHGLVDVYWSHRREIAEISPTAPATPGWRKIGSPGLARSDANASVGILPLPILPRNGLAQAARSTRRSTHAATQTPCFILRRLLHLADSQVHLVRCAIVEALMNAARVVQVDNRTPMLLSSA